MDTLSSVFGEYIKQVVKLSKSPPVVKEENVYQEADYNILPYLDKMVEETTLDGSGLQGLSNLEELLLKAESGKSCLLLSEHFSNMDLCLITYMIRKAGGRGEDIARAMIAIAGMKLTEENAAVSAFASAYSRIVIYPSRSLQHLDAEKDKAEIIRSNAINRAAMKALMELKYKGHLVLLFPSGTRYRPWDPSSKRGLREIDSYIKSFDYFCLLSINGVVLKPVKEGNMTDDEVVKDVVCLSASPVISCSDFRNKAREEAETNVSDKTDIDKKQAVADKIMAELEKMHEETEIRRQLYLRPTDPGERNL